MRSARTVVGLLVVWVVMASFAKIHAVEEPTVRIVFPDGHTIEAELAVTPQERGRGLMFRTSLPDDRGMLFVFEEDAEQLFTMKNMLFDLDVVFLGPDRRIREVFESLPHPQEFAVDEGVRRVRAKGKYVLELLAGISRAHGLTVGDILEFRPPRPAEVPFE